MCKQDTPAPSHLQAAPPGAQAKRVPVDDSKPQKEKWGIRFAQQVVLEQRVQKAWTRFRR
jgi:hypothetical protein